MAEKIRHVNSDDSTSIPLPLEILPGITNHLNIVHISRASLRSERYLGSERSIMESDNSRSIPAPWPGIPATSHARKRSG